MARVTLSGLDSQAATQLESLLAIEGHQVQRRGTVVGIEDLLSSDIVFMGGAQGEFLSLLRRLRAADPNLPVVVVARMPETSEWLDVLEAGATDYCVPPFDVNQIRSLIASSSSVSSSLIELG